MSAVGCAKKEYIPFKYAEGDMVRIKISGDKGIITGTYRSYDHELPCYFVKTFTPVRLPFVTDTGKYGNHNVWEYEIEPYDNKAEKE